MIRWDIIDPGSLPDRDLLAEYHASTADAGDARQTALAAEIEHRNLDV